MTRSLLSALVHDARFEVVRELGRTPWATVHLVYDHVDASFRVVKILAEAQRAGARMLRAFVRDARMLGRLEHPGILRVYRTGLLAGRPYLLSEYADGGSAAAWIARHGPMPAVDAVEIVARAAEAVAAAHDVGVIHRDLKPSNLLLAGRGALVADFGVADALACCRGAADLSFAAPEQRQDDASIGVAADVYALGATLVALVTGQASPTGALHRRVPEPLRPLVARACDRRPEARHATARDLADALRQVSPALREPRSNRPADDDGPSLVLPGLPPVPEPRSRLRQLWDSCFG